MTSSSEYSWLAYKRWSIKVTHTFGIFGSTANHFAPAVRAVFRASGDGAPWNSTKSHVEGCGSEQEPDHPPQSSGSCSALGGISAQRSPCSAKCLKWSAASPFSAQIQLTTNERNTGRRATRNEPDARRRNLRKSVRAAFSSQVYFPTNAWTL